MNRLRATIHCDVRLQYRNGFYYAAAVVAVLFVLLLRQLSHQNLAWVLPVIIVNNVIVNTFYFLGGLVLLEKGEGTLQAQIVTPLRADEYLVAKVVTLTLLSVVETLAIVGVAYGVPSNPFALVAGITLAAGLYALAGFVVVARYDAINEYLLPSMVYVTVLALPLLPYFGVGSGTVVSVLTYLHPLKPILVLLQAGFGAVTLWHLGYGLMYAALWIALFYVAARRTFYRFVVRSEGTGG